MTGVPSLKVEQWLNAGWVDVSSRLQVGGSGVPIQIVRGVGDKIVPQPGTCTLQLDNSDGALTPDRAASAYFPTVTRYRQIRVSAYIGGSWRARFGGYVDTEPLSWRNPMGTDCRVTIGAIDALGMAGLRPLRSVAVEATAGHGPIAYWPLTDPATLVAGEQSGNSAPGLELLQEGTGGEISWGAGTVLPTDSGGGVVFTPETENGPWLRSASGIDLPASWSLSVWPTPAAKDGYVCQVGTDSYAIGIWYDTSTDKLSAVETLLDSSGTPIDYALSTTTATWTSGMETLTVTPTTVKLGSSSTTGTRHQDDTMLGALVSAGGAIVSKASREKMYSGGVSHLALWDPTVPGTLAADQGTGPTAMFTREGAVETVLSWAGVPVSATTLGADVPAQLLRTDGLTALDCVGQLGMGSGARIYCQADGSVAIASWEYSPTPAAAPSGELETMLGEWSADQQGDITEAVMSWPDGWSYRAVESAAWGRSQVDLPGILPRATGRTLADWLVAADTGRPRFPNAVYDLATLPDPSAVALVEVGEILTVPGLPSQLPASSQSDVVDQITETISATEWVRTLSTSPDLRDELMVVGDATRGEVGALWLAAPFGPPSPPSSWKAGDPVTAAKLNASAWAGGDMQTGTVSITPVASTPTSLAVTFPRAFSAAPTVVVMPVTDKPYSEVRGAAVSSISTTGFTAWIYRTNTTATTVAWIAC